MPFLQGVTLRKSLLGCYAPLETPKRALEVVTPRDNNEKYSRVLLGSTCVTRKLCPDIAVTIESTMNINILRFGTLAVEAAVLIFIYICRDWGPHETTSLFNGSKVEPNSY